MAELETSDPFGPTTAPGVSLIVLMRLYDVGIAILDSLDRDKAQFLLDTHERGGIVGSLPTINIKQDQVEDKLPTDEEAIAHAKEELVRIDDTLANSKRVRQDWLEYKEKKEHDELPGKYKIGRRWTLGG